MNMCPSLKLTVLSGHFWVWKIWVTIFEGKQSAMPINRSRLSCKACAVTIRNINLEIVSGLDKRYETLWHDLWNEIKKKKIMMISIWYFNSHGCSRMICDDIFMKPKNKLNHVNGLFYSISSFNHNTFCFSNQQRNSKHNARSNVRTEKERKKEKKHRHMHNRL